MRPYPETRSKLVARKIGQTYDGRQAKNNKKAQCSNELGRLEIETAARHGIQTLTDILTGETFGRISLGCLNPLLSKIAEQQAVVPG